jgi:hypothetical protein
MLVIDAASLQVRERSSELATKVHVLFFICLYWLTRAWKNYPRPWCLSSLGYKPCGDILFACLFRLPQFCRYPKELTVQKDSL